MECPQMTEFKLGDIRIGKNGSKLKSSLMEDVKCDENQQRIW